MINNQLINHAYHGNLEKVIYCLEQGASVNYDNDYSLRISALNGYTELVKFLIDNGADVNADHDYALKASAENGHLEIVKLLILHGANRKNEALQKSAENGHLEIVILLVENGADIYSNNDYALKWSIKNDHYDIIEYLLPFYRKEELKKILKVLDIRDKMLNFLLRADLTKYSMLVSLYREFAIDIFDLINDEIAIY